MMILLLLFTILLLLVNYYPAVTLWDSAFIVFIQSKLNVMPVSIPLLPDCRLYTIMIILPLITGCVYFFRKNLYFNILLLCSTPLTAFILNCIVKNIVKRERPPIELHLGVHPESYGFVSSHSLVTFCLYGIVIFFTQKYLKNEILKNSTTAISVLWILFVGLSRIWLGVHYPTDVLGAYILGGIMLLCYIKLFYKSEAKKNEKRSCCFKF